jgi:hypothetical protein
MKKMKKKMKKNEIKKKRGERIIVDTYKERGGGRGRMKL